MINFIDSQDEIDDLYDFLYYYIYLRYDDKTLFDYKDKIETSLLYKLLPDENVKAKISKVIAFCTYANILSNVDLIQKPSIVRCYNNILKQEIVNILTETHKN